MNDDEPDLNNDFFEDNTTLLSPTSKFKEATMHDMFSKVVQITDDEESTSLKQSNNQNSQN